jgi:RNA polymerase sigma-70 factor (ECF subfamily)
MDELNEELVEDDRKNNIEVQLSIHQALQLLPTLEQEILLLRYVNELSIGEICKITDLSRFAIYRKTNAALATLKTVLRKEDFFE